MNEAPVPLERVRGHVRPAASFAAPAPQPPPDDGLAVDPPEDGEQAPRALSAGDAVPVLTVGFVGLVSGELLVSVLAGVAALAALALRRAAIRERFGFGDGFTPFRSDLGWPRGVQEDDDFHWSWTGTRDEATPGARRPVTR